MKGLLIKDFMILRKHCLVNVLVSLIFFAISILSYESMYFAYYSVAIFSVVSITLFAYDESYRWNRFECVLPLKRSTVVNEKYLFLLTIVIPAVLIESICFGIRFHLDKSDLISLMSLMLFYGFVSPIIVIPILFKFGFVKGKMINMLVIAIMASAITVINFKNSADGLMLEGYFTPQRDAVLFAVLAVILLFISWIISRIIYSKKQFY
ncbi:MAG: ABC-2 transporter permease [Eubacterium sp.]|nr:ABC-2 transporter permease [Eubacterium sp.]MDE6154913.1 ABC-2 transporter permease [Eubacterium sp.]